MAKKAKHTDRFQWSEGAIEYHRKISKNKSTGEFGTIFDFYYLCCMVGFKYGKVAKSTKSQAFLGGAGYHCKAIRLK